MTSTRTRLRPFVQHELALAAQHRRAHDLAAAWRSLERAHVVSQPSAWLHTRVHAAMLALAVRTRDPRETVGQVVRLAVAALGSLLGRYPLGNTGRARVSLTAPMPIPDDLARVLADARTRP